MADSNNSPILSKEQIDYVVDLYSHSKYEEAVVQIKILNEKYPNVPLLFNLVGACYKALGQLESSEKMFQKAVSIKPDYAEAHKNLGIVQKFLGQFEASIQSFKKAIFLILANVLGLVFTLKTSTFSFSTKLFKFSMPSSVCK